MNLYYIPPSEEIFNELKQKCIELWYTMDDTIGYATEKVSKFKNIENIGDNFMYMVAMFDMENQRKLSMTLSRIVNKAISDRLKSAGVDPMYNVFNNNFVDDDIASFDVNMINRIEVINHAKNRFDVGRVLTMYQERGDFKNIDVSVQDDGRTLKIFVN